MIPLINHDSQWGRSEVVIIYPDLIDMSVDISVDMYFIDIKLRFFILIIIGTVWLSLFLNDNDNHLNCG